MGDLFSKYLVGRVLEGGIFSLFEWMESADWVVGGWVMRVGWLVVRGVFLWRGGEFCCGWGGGFSGWVGGKVGLMARVGGSGGCWYGGGVGLGVFRGWDCFALVMISCI